LSTPLNTPTLLYSHSSLLTNLHSSLQGTIHTGQPVGTYQTLHNLKTYTTGNPSTARATLIMYSDVFGHSLPNNLILADALAAQGNYLVHLPDFFEGDPVKLQLADALIPVDAKNQSTIRKYTGLLANAPSFLMWMGRHGHERTERVCMDFLASVRRQTLAKGVKIGMVGYCWGGRYAIRAGLEKNQIEVKGEMVPLVDAVVALHPSNLVLPGDVGKLVVPVSYGWGEQDTMVSIELKGKIENLHGKEKGGGRVVPEMDHRVYNPGRHGFAVRGNPDDAEERNILEGSERQALEWLGKWL
jgi:dienelactone hydrolase